MTCVAGTDSDDNFNRLLTSGGMDAVYAVMSSNSDSAVVQSAASQALLSIADICAASATALRDGRAVEMLEAAMALHPSPGWGGVKYYAERVLSKITATNNY